MRGRQNEKRQSELNLAMTLFSIVLMHILCNILRVILGVLVVTLVGTELPVYFPLWFLKRILSLEVLSILIFLRFLDFGWGTFNLFEVFSNRIEDEFYACRRKPSNREIWPNEQIKQFAWHLIEFWRCLLCYLRTLKHWLSRIFF